MGAVQYPVFLTFCATPIQGGRLLHLGRRHATTGRKIRLVGPRWYGCFLRLTPKALGPKHRLGYRFRWLALGFVAAACEVFFNDPPSP
jgi:hypothetical protein